MVNDSALRPPKAPKLSAWKCDRKGGYRFSEKIMLKKQEHDAIRPNRVVVGLPERHSFCHDRTFLAGPLESTKG